MSKETGGAAFALPRNPNGGPVDNGMTLRDYFAAKAMSAFIHMDEFDRQNEVLMAQRSYDVADAMLEERNK